MHDISGLGQAATTRLSGDFEAFALGKTTLPSPEKMGDASVRYALAMDDSGGFSAEKIAFNFNSVFNKSVDLAQLVFQLRLLIRDAQAAEAELVISNIEANVQALFDKADTIIEHAKEAKSKADAAAWMTILSGAISIAGGVAGWMRAGSGLKNPNVAAAQSQALNSGFGGLGSMVGGGGQLLSNDAEYIRQESQAAQAELDALANKAQADKQRAEAQENFYKDLLANLKKIADDLLQEITQVTRNVGRNI